MTTASVGLPNKSSLAIAYEFQKGALPHKHIAPNIGRHRSTLLGVYVSLSNTRALAFYITNTRTARPRCAVKWRTHRKHRCSSEKVTVCINLQSPCFELTLASKIQTAHKFYHEIPVIP